MAYFFKFILLLSLLVAIVTGITIGPKINDFIQRFGTRMVEYYPDELEITIKDGKTSTNVNEPYYLPIPDEFIGALESEAVVYGINQTEIENLLVIDTKQTFSVESFEQYKTLALLTEDSVVYFSDRGKLEVMPLAPTLNLTINANLIDNWAGKLVSFGNSIPWIILPIVVFLLAFFSCVFKLIYLLFGALLIWPLARAVGRKINYAEAYRVGIHAMTLPIIVIPILTWIFGIAFPFDFTILMLVILIINWVKSKNQEVANSPLSSNPTVDVPKINDTSVSV